MSIYEKLQKAADSDTLRLHTPGHKGNLCGLDMTELSDGSFPADAVQNAEKLVADIYGAKNARFLSGGSSQGVKSAIYYAGTNAVADVNSHRAVFDGFRLSGKNCVTAGERGGIRPLTVEQIDGAITPDIGAVVVTSPTYYGYCADVAAIAEYCKRKGLLFIIDGAHGAHFGFSNRLPESHATHCDIINLSTHKTLSSLTQSALLLDNLPRAEHARLSDVTDVMGTTSPSYLLYASIEYAAVKASSADTAARYDALYAPVLELKKKFPFEDNDDFTRLVLDCERIGSPDKIDAELSRRGVFCEKTDGRYIVFILTAEDGPSDVEHLARALSEVCK